MYSGGFIEGKREGKGLLKYKSGDILFYDGEFKEDRKHGMGVEKYKDGRIFYVKYYKDQCLRMEYNVSEKAVKTVVGQDLDYKFEKHKTLEALSLR